MFWRIIIFFLLYINNERNYKKLKIIGILTYQSQINSKKYPKELYNEIPGSYIDWVLQSNAQVIFINYDESSIETLKKLKNINGVLITGGPGNLFKKYNKKKIF